MVGQWAVEMSTGAPWATGIGLGLVAGAKQVGAAIPVGVVRGRMPWSRFWRGASWVGGLLLVAYGAVNTIVPLAVLVGLVQPTGSNDIDAMRALRSRLPMGPAVYVLGRCDGPVPVTLLVTANRDVSSTRQGLKDRQYFRRW